MNKIRRTTHNIKQLGFIGLREFGSRANILVGGQERSPKTQPFHIVKRCSQLYRLSTQRLNIDMKPKELLIEAVNKFYERKAQKEGIYVLRFTIEIYEKAKGRSYWCNWL